MNDQSSFCVNAVMDKLSLLQVENLRKSFPVKSSLFSLRSDMLLALNDVSFSVEQGETLGLVGESGCGKSTIAKLIMCLDAPDSGAVFYRGENIFSMNRYEKREFRKKVQIVFQDPFSSLNPRKKVSSIIGEPLVIHKMFPDRFVRKKVYELMSLVGLPREYADRYPHEFSSGQRQRIGIARALSLNPEMIVADEPVSALDVSIQAQTINLFMDLQKEMDLTYLFISHDLSVVRHISTRIAVMYLGKLIEIADSDELFQRPLHPYTRLLLSSVPVPDPMKKRNTVLLQGDVPSPMAPLPGCVFSSRCPDVRPDICHRSQPRLKDTGHSHAVACFLRA